MGFLEDFAACGAGEDIVAEREEEVGVGGDIGFGLFFIWVGLG